MKTYDHVKFRNRRADFVMPPDDEEIPHVSSSPAPVFDEAQYAFEKMHSTAANRYTDEELGPRIVEFLSQHQGQGYTYNELAREYGVTFGQAGRVVAWLAKQQVSILFHTAKDDHKPFAVTNRKDKPHKLYWYAPLRVMWEKADSPAARQKIVQNAILGFVRANEDCSESAIRKEILRLFIHLSVDTIRAAIKVLEDTGRIEGCLDTLYTSSGRKYSHSYRVP